MGAIFYLSAQSDLPDVPRPEVGGVAILPAKLAHVAVYSILAALLYFALAPWRWLGWGHPLIAFAGATLYGVSDEFHQSFVPLRTAAWTDVALDALGAALVLLVLVLLRRWRSRKGPAARPPSAR